MTTDLYIEAGLPSDEELERITDYVGHFMTPAERTAFDTQLQDDDAFFYRVAPVIDAWYGTGSPPAAEIDQPRPSRWPRRVAAFATFAVAAGLLLMVKGGTQKHADAPSRVAKVSPQPTPVIPPPTTLVQATPKVIAVRPPIRKHLPTSTQVVTVTVTDPIVVTIDSTAEARIALWADSARAAGFVPLSRVTDTVEAIGVQTSVVWLRPQIDSNTKTRSKYPTATDANGAPKTESSGLLGIIKRLLRTGKSGGTS
jgi:hypothetical protein